TGGFIYYNTNILNRYVPTKTRYDRQASYEKKYRQYLDLPQPRITDVEADVDIHPETRSVDIRGRYMLENKTAAPLDHLHLYLNPDVTIRSLQPQYGILEMQDKELGYRIYRLDPPLQPGASMTVSFDLAIESHGFVNNGERNEVVAKGTFFDNIVFFPHV